MKKNKRKRGRPKGTIYGKRILLNIDAEMLAEIKTNAKKMKISNAQWLRNTIARGVL